MGEELKYYLYLKDSESRATIMRLPLDEEGIYNILNRVYKTLLPVVVCNVDPECELNGVNPSKFYYEIFLLCNIFDYLKEKTPHIFKYPFVKEQLKLIRTYRNFLMKYVKYEYIDYKIAKHPHNCSTIQSAFASASKISFDFRPIIVSPNIETNLLAVAVLQKKDMDLSNLNSKKEENNQNSEDDESVENVYLEDNLDESRDVVLEKVVAESLEKDKLNYNDYEFIEVHYLHPKYLQFFENLADSIDVLVDFDYCLNLTTIFIFYASLLESRFVLRKEEKEQTERIISKLKTKLHSNNRVDFDDNNLIQMTSEVYEFSVIDMPSTYNNLTILSQAIINYYVSERDYEFFESIDSLLFKKDSDESFNALTTVEFLLKTFEDDELNDFTKCLKHLVKDKGSVNFYRELKDTYIKITKNPTYEFLFGRDDGRDEYE